MEIWRKNSGENYNFNNFKMITNCCVISILSTQINLHLNEDGSRNERIDKWRRDLYYDNVHILYPMLSQTGKVKCEMYLM